MVAAFLFVPRGEPAVLFGFIWLFFAAAGAGLLSLVGWRPRHRAACAGPDRDGGRSGVREASTRHGAERQPEGRHSPG